MKMNTARRVVAAKVTQSWQNIPHVAYLYEPDVTELLTVFQQLRTRCPYPLTLNTLLLWIITQGLKEAPYLNARCQFDPTTNRGDVEPLPHIHIDIPWLFPGGQMLTVTARDMQDLDVFQMAACLSELRSRVNRTDPEQLIRQTFQHTASSSFTLKPEELGKGTVTVSNIGSICKYSGHLALMEILPPQVFAVGINSLQQKPAVLHGSVVPRKILPLSLFFDHRALDSHHLLPFLDCVNGYFLEPHRIEACIS